MYSSTSSGPVEEDACSPTGNDGFEIREQKGAGHSLRNNTSSAGSRTIAYRCRLQAVAEQDSTCSTCTDGLSAQQDSHFALDAVKGEEIIKFRGDSLTNRVHIILGREEERRWRAEDLEQRALDNARQLWARFVEKNRRDVEERAEQLKGFSNLAALVAGFVMISYLQVRQHPLICPSVQVSKDSHDNGACTDLQLRSGLT